MDTSTIVASEIMTRQLATAGPAQHVLDAIDCMVARRVSCMPVLTSRGHFVGQFSERTAIAAMDLADANSDDGPLDAKTCLRLLVAADVMQPPTLVLKPDQDVFDSVAMLLRGRASGAPVVTPGGTLLGVFSEKSAMQVFIGLCWEQMPSSKVTAWMEDGSDRCIAEGTTMIEILDRFQHSTLRRLMVVREGRLVGEVSRRDALVAAVECSRTPLKATRNPANSGHAALKADVETWMNRDVPSISPAVDVLTIAQMFIHSQARQLPVLDHRTLVGQISRSDLLRAVQRYFPAPIPEGTGPQPLYLSSVREDRELAMLS
ncbi:MAG: CBS domain-containing protein [Planctomycetaceae bacterium]